MSGEKQILYKIASVHRTPAVQPSKKRIPRDWTAVPIGTGEQALELKWSDTNTGQGDYHPEDSIRLRITVAIEIREEIRVEAYLLESGTVLGTFDVRYAYVYQPYEIILTAAQAKAALQEGVGLRIPDPGTAETALWIFDDLLGDSEKSSFTPHLIMVADGDRMEHFLDRMLSLSSLQPFGWFEGCVLDGLYDLRGIVGAQQAERVIAAHLEQFILSNGELHYEDLHGRPADGRFSGNESTLPLAVLAKLQMDHPLVSKVISYWPSLSSHVVVTAESAYTVGYPMATIAARLHDEELAQRAIEQILIRRDHLIDGDDLYGIVHSEKEERTMKNWARSYTWYMLGMVRTWIELHQSPRFAELSGMREIQVEFQRIANVAMARRETNGLWSCFLGETETGIETSGSAGIAAALALGTRYGLLDSTGLTVAGEALQTLESYLTPDGLLSGVCQHNCGGLQLQRGGYRTLSQMGMGLMAQLYVAVHVN